jgi:protein SCO1/2
VDLRLSLVEASQNRIGTVTDKLLLFCYHYDPLTGRYGWAVQNLLRAGGALTVVLLGTMMFLLVRYDRRRTRRLMPPADPAPEAGEAFP